VKTFIREDLKLFHNVEFKPIPGHNPDLVLVNAEDDEVERIDLAPLNRDECNKLLLRKGFYKKNAEDEAVPTEYEHGPYEEKQDL